MEIWVEDGYSLGQLRALFESIRDDPGLPSEALLLFDGRTRKERLAESDVRARLEVDERFAASVCEPDYSPFFTNAVSVISEACDDFVPIG